MLLFHFHQFNLKVQFFSSHLMVCVKCNSFFIFRVYLYREWLTVLILSLIHIFLSLECYQVLLQFIGGLQSNPSQQPAWEKYVRPVLTIIHTRYMEDLTADALSQKVFVTPQYLSRLFSRYLGCSVYEYLTKFRISKAKELLVSHRTRKIQDISQDVGYTDASHFVLMFRCV